jgi:hypothetical protein
MIIEFLKEVITGKANKFMLCALVYLVTDQAFLRSRISDLELQVKNYSEGYKDMLQLRLQKDLTGQHTPKKIYLSPFNQYYIKPKEEHNHTHAPLRG